MACFTAHSQTFGEYRSKVDGDWNSVSTWEYYNGSSWVDATNYPGEDDVITISSGTQVESNSVSIGSNGDLHVDGFLIVNGDLNMNENGAELYTDSGANVIIYGTANLGNKVTIDLSSYFVVLGDFLRNGSAQQGSITITDAHVYIFGEVSSSWDNFTACEDGSYDGTTGTVDDACDAGRFDDFVEHVDPLELPDGVFYEITGMLPGTVNKQLYLSDPSQALDRIDPVATGDVTNASTDLLGQVFCGTVGTFSTPDDITGDLGGNDATTSDLSVYVSPEGIKTLHVVFLGKGTGDNKKNIYYSSKTGASAWTTPVPVSANSWNQDVQEFPAIKADANNKAHIVYAHKKGTSPADSKINIYYVTNESGSWSTPVRISNDAFGNDAFTPEIALDSNGKGYVVYQSRSSTDSKKNIYYTTNVSGSWSSPVRISSDTFGNDVLLNPAIAIDAGNKAHAVYSHKSGSDSKVNIYYVTNTSGSWSTPVRISSDSYNQDAKENPSIAIDENEKPHVVYAHKSDPAGDSKINIYYVNKTGASWSAPVNISKDVNNQNSGNPDLGFCSNGMVRVAFSNNDMQIYYTEGSGTSWASPVDINPNTPTKSDAGLYPAIAVTDTTVDVVFQDHGVSLSRINIWHTSSNLSVTGDTETTFTQSPALCDDLTIKAGTITVSNYITVVDGSMPASPVAGITATLKYGATPILILTNPTYSGGVLTWTGTLGADVTVPAGEAIVLNISTTLTGINFTIDYDSQTKPSKIVLPVSSFINIASLAVYDAPYPGGTVINEGLPNGTAYIRAEVSDPFGYTDITDLNFDITPTVGVVAASSVATDGCTRTYEYVWNTPASGSTYNIEGTAEEGYEGTVTDVENLTFDFCTDCSPVAVDDKAIVMGESPGVSIDVLANDYDPNGNLDAGSLAVLSGPSYGTAVATAGQVVYIPNGTYTETDQFTYQICDNTSPTPLCATAKVNISSTVNKQLYLTDPSQALDRIDPVASTDGTTASTANLSSTSGIQVVNTVTNSSANPGSTTFTVSNVTVGTGLNRLMLVGISQKNKNVTGVTYGGTPLTPVGENTGNGNARMHLYSLLNPPSGTANVVVTLDANPDKGIVVGVTNFTGVDQSTPLANFYSANGKGTTASVTITSAAGDLVYDVATYRNTTMTANGSQAVRYNIDSGGEVYGGASTKTGASSVSMSWTGSDQDWAIGAVSVKPATVITSTTFTQAPALCSNLTLKAGTVTITNYVTVTSGSMPANPAITAQLKYGASNIITISDPTYNSGLLTWTGTLGTDVTVPAGLAISLVVSTAQTGVIFTVDYDSQTKPSKIVLPVSSFIDIVSYEVYDAPYPAGNIITSATSGTIVYPRAVVTDPFGTSDITELNIAIPPPGTDVAATSVSTAGCTRTYEYVWNTTSFNGNYFIPATAKEGLENSVTDVQPLSFDVCATIGIPVFDLGATSVRCEGAESVTYSATSSNATGISYALDVASITGGNSINASTGEVTYVDGWNGTTVITATAEGCDDPKSADHTVTITSAGPASSTPTLCFNTPLTNITHTTTGATGIGDSGVSGANGLPEGVSATWASDAITISGIPTASGIFNYSIPLTGGCGAINATGTITVNALPTATISSNNSPICEKDYAEFTITGTSGAIVTYNINGNSDTVTLTGGTATITVFVDIGDGNQTLNLDSLVDSNCSQLLSESSTITVNILPEIGSFN